MHKQRRPNAKIQPRSANDWNCTGHLSAAFAPSPGSSQHWRQLLGSPATPTAPFTTRPPRASAVQCTFPSTGDAGNGEHTRRVPIRASRQQSGGPGGAGRERAQPGTGHRTRSRPCLAWQSPGSSEASRVGGCVLGAGDPTMSRSQNAASRWPPASWPLLMAQAPRKGPRPALLAWGAFVLRPSSHARLPDTVCAPEGQAPAPAPRTNTQTTPANAVHRNTLVSQTPGAEAWTPQGGVDVCPLWRA